MWFKIDWPLSILLIIYWPNSQSLLFCIVGLIFDQLLSHVNTVARVCYFYLSKIARICYFLDKEECKKIVYALVISKLEYCNVLRYGLPDSKLKLLQQVQNYAARIVTLLGNWGSDLSHITHVLHNLHWLTVDMWIVFTVLLYTYKASHALLHIFVKLLICIYQADD